MSEKPSVVFVCVANSFRSQLAEAAARVYFGDQWEIWSAGSHPGGGVHPMAAATAAEAGWDMSGHHSKGLQDLPRKTWDYVVTMGCGDNCPTLSAKQRIDWQIPDPVGLSPEALRRLPDDIAQRVKALMQRR